MPSYHLLFTLITLFALQSVQGLPTGDGSLSQEYPPSPPSLAERSIPTSLLGRHYSHQKRDPLNIMDPSLEPGMSQSEPSPPPSSHEKTKVPPRQFNSNLLSSIRLRNSKSKREQPHDVNYLSNVGPMPPSPVASSVPPPPGTPPPFQGTHYKEYSMSDPQAKPNVQTKTAQGKKGTNKKVTENKTKSSHSKGVKSKGAKEAGSG